MTVEIINIDCMEYMPGIAEQYFDLAIVDPPYFEGPNKTGYYGKGYSSIGVKRAKCYQNAENWEVPNVDYFKELKRVSKHQIIWGANHFASRFNSSSSCWIIWDKVNGKSSFADAELAYTSFKGATRIFKYMWNGMHQGSFGGDVSRNEKRIHPTQKPVVLYDWLLQKFAKKGYRILDTHLGSGSSAIAAHFFGVDFVGCEIDPNYYQAAKERFYRETAQLSLFD